MEDCAYFPSAYVWYKALPLRYFHCLTYEMSRSGSSCAKSCKDCVKFGSRREEISNKPGTGTSLHTQEPVTVASFRTWRGWREYVARDRCLTEIILAFRIRSAGTPPAVVAGSTPPHSDAPNHFHLRHMTFGARICRQSLPFQTRLSNNGGAGS